MAYTSSSNHEARRLLGTRVTPQSKCFQQGNERVRSRGIRLHFLTSYCIQWLQQTANIPNKSRGLRI
jgi:hypothetical protein